MLHVREQHSRPQGFPLAVSPRVDSLPADFGPGGLDTGGIAPALFFVHTIRYADEN
jgi:hypothetical protein